jgi:Tfp pilus assembly protein PilZ
VELNTERRTHKRLKNKASVSHDILTLEIVHTGRIYNFSNSGLYLESNQTFYPGEEVYILMGNRPQLAEGDTQFFLCVEIIWHQNLQSSSYRYGYGAKLLETNDALARSMSTAKLEKKTRQSGIIDNGIDSRKCHRRPSNKLFLFTHQNRRCKGYIKNISRSGALIETKNKLSLGKAIILAIPRRKSRKDIYLRGWIVRLNSNGGGVKFDQRSGRERRSDLDRRFGLERRRRNKSKNRNKIYR